jgi:hypothetical protein
MKFIPKNTQNAYRLLSQNHHQKRQQNAFPPTSLRTSTNILSKNGTLKSTDTLMLVENIEDLSPATADDLHLPAQASRAAHITLPLSRMQENLCEDCLLPKRCDHWKTT